MTEHFTIVPGAKWLLSSTRRGVVYVFGHTEDLHSKNLDYIELGFVWP